MKLFRRTLALLLVFCFIGLALVACGTKPGNAETDAGENNGSAANKVTETETNIYGEPSFTTANDYDAFDFEGEELVMLIRNNIQNTREWYKESPEDELDEAIAMRNAAVCESLNVTLSFEFLDGNGMSHSAYVDGLMSSISTDVLSDLHYYDIGCNFAGYTSSAAIRDYAANFMDKEQFPYFDFSLPCWNQAIVKNTTFNGRLHYVAGDSNISMFDAAMIMWHNKTLYDEKKDETDYENMQDLALEGLWTYDELYRWASIFEDSNGTAGKQADDTYGFGAYGKNNPCPTDCLPYAWDLTLLVENNDQTHEYSIVGNDKAEQALENFRKLLVADGSTMSANIAANTRNFAAGHYVFYNDRLFWGYEENMMIREMDDKYGLLPMPKYDAQQENYGTTAQDYYNLYMIIDHAKSSVPTKGEAISAFLQLANEESYTGVRGYYFNRVIKPKFFGTDDSEGTVTKSVALFDIIISNIEFDFITIYCVPLNNLHILWRNACYGSGSLESAFLGNEQTFNDALIACDVWLGLRSED